MGVGARRETERNSAFLGVGDATGLGADGLADEAGQEDHRQQVRQRLDGLDGYADAENLGALQADLQRIFMTLSPRQRAAAIEANSVKSGS